VSVDLICVCAGILSVSAEEKSAGVKSKITITNDKGRLSKDQVQAMIRDAEVYRQDDQVTAERVQWINAVENYAHGVKATIEDPKLRDKADPQLSSALSQCIEDTLAWIRSGSDEITKVACEERLSKIEGLCAAVMEKLTQQDNPALQGAAITTASP